MALRLHRRKGLIPVQKITLTRAEGMSHETFTAVAKSYTEANALLKEWAHTAPGKGKGYHKTDIEVQWTDGFLWRSTYDLVRKTATKNKPIENWIRNQWAFMAGLWKPTHMSAERYEAARKHVSRKEQEIARMALEDYEL
jgi:hypothetical protein